MTAPVNPKLQIHPTAIPDVLILEPKVFGDQRGCFIESLMPRILQKQLDLISSLCKTIIPSPGSGPCGVYSISSNTRKAN